MKKESKFSKEVKAICLEHDFLCYFVQPVAGSEGVPDAILKSPLGNTLHLELKTGSKLRDGQIIFLERSNNAWECKWNFKRKRAEVILDDEKVDLGIFLSVQRVKEVKVQEIIAEMNEEAIQNTEDLCYQARWEEYLGINQEVEEEK